MPSRLVTAAIILFWLGTTGWLVYREAAPHLVSGEAPPFTIDLTDEVGAKLVMWTVWQKGELIGRGSTQVKRRDDGAFEFSADFRLDHLKALSLTIDTKMRSTYRVSEEGRLLHAAASLKADIAGPIEFDFEGDVRDGRMHPRVRLLWGGQTLAPALDPVVLPQSGAVLNPMHLVHKISALRPGRKWTIPLMDPLKGLRPPGTSDLEIGHVTAEVKLDVHEWHDANVDCYKIEYRRPDGTLVAATWVRRSDDFVLEQWASHEGFEYSLVRQRDS